MKPPKKLYFLLSLPLFLLYPQISLSRNLGVHHSNKTHIAGDIRNQNEIEHTVALTELSLVHDKSTMQSGCLVPCGAALKPWTNLAEFSLKKRWRYMMRTSAWQPRFRTSTESLISREKPSAAIEPMSASSSRAKSFRNTQCKKVQTKSPVSHCTWNLWTVNGKNKIVIKHKVQLHLIKHML